MEEINREADRTVLEAPRIHVGDMNMGTIIPKVNYKVLLVESGNSGNVREVKVKESKSKRRKQEGVSRKLPVPLPPEEVEHLVDDTRPKRSEVMTHIYIYI